MRVLTFTTLYPNAARPNQGVFVETRVKELIRTTDVSARVMAPVAWFPSRNPRYGRYAEFAAAPPAEARCGLEIVHPRYLAVPKLGMNIAPVLLAAGAYRAVRRMIAGGYDFDVIDAHYFYPDGVAAAMLAKRLGKPVIVTARGTDINVLPHYAVPRTLVTWAAAQAAAVIAVSSALKESLLGLGVSASKITVLRNGVDTRTFRPLDGADVRADLAIAGPVLLMVGNLVPLKRHVTALQALTQLPSATLVIIGSGPEEGTLRKLAAQLGIERRVRFVGSVPHEELPRYYSAADALLLVSSSEGWPNVLLEAMACGTPAVAARVGGTPEIVTTEEAGVLLAENTVPALCSGIRALLASYPDRRATRRHAERFGWGETSRGQLQIFEHAVATRHAATPLQTAAR